MNVTVRQIQVEDKKSWQEVYLSYLKFYESEPVESSTELLWNRLTNGEPEIQGFVAESNGDIVGIAHFHYQVSTWSDTFHCYLEDLYVTESSRSNGVATTLIAEVKKFAIEHDCSELFWITKESNQTARKLYDRVAKVSDFVRYEIMLEE